MEKSANKTGDIRDFWNENPCGTNFIDYEIGEQFFTEYDTFRYETEGHILEELDRTDFKDKKVLEIGLGQGADSMQIIKRGGIYHGIDLTAESVKRVKTRFEIFGCEYKDVQQADATKIPYPDNYFDIVYSHGVIHHSPEIETIVNEIHRVLKPNAKAIIMLYNKDSFNYYVSISMLRRFGLLSCLAFPGLAKFISKATGEPVERINKHLSNYKNKGFSYLKMKNFTHKSTDGPDNVWTTVWNKKSVAKLFHKFKMIETKIHFLNERHLLGLQRILGDKTKHQLSRNYGWHLWSYFVKE
jgi:ubiquinone/menaquinone biosynthesis C-methylase UbiE